MIKKNNIKTDLNSLLKRQTIYFAYIFGEVANLKHNALNISDGYNSGTDNSLFFYYIRTCKKNLFGILILIAYFASCNQIHKTHYENGWYHILSQQKDSIAKESIVTVKDFVSLRMDSDENGTCVIVGQISKHKLKNGQKKQKRRLANI